VRILLLLTALAAQGCFLDTHEITGHWAISSDGANGSCIPGEQIYVEVRDEEAEWFDCVEGTFSTSVSTAKRDFTVELTLDGGGQLSLAYQGFAYVQLEHITDDFDVGLVTFERN
jgi:hypothetical protein